MAQILSPKIVTDNLVLCLDPSQNKSLPTSTLPVKDGLVMWMDAADDSTFSFASPAQQTVTITIASPAVITLTSHGLSVGDKIYFTTTGALPTGITASAFYYVSVVDSTNAFKISATLGGSNVNTSGTQSGTHYLYDTTQVSQWRDKSGSDYHMTPKSAGPVRRTALNSKKVLRFTTSQTIGNNTINLSASANTVFAVTRLTGTTNGRVLTCNLDASGNNWLLGHHGGTVNDYYAEGWVYDSATSADTTWRIFMGNWSGSSTDLANFYSNGTALATNNTQASQGPNKIGINYYSNETSTCEAAEIIVYNRVLSTQERQLIHTYLGLKWGISNTDRSIIDLSNNNNNGSLGNATVANMPDYDFYNKGALTFNGTSDYVNLGNESSIRMGSGDFTISTWIKILTQTGTPTFKLIITSKNAAAAAAGYGFAWNNSVNKFLWSTANGSSSSEIFTTNTWSSLEGVWANVVMIRQNGATNNGHFYINGVYESLASAATVLNVDTATNMTVANSADLNSSYWFKGLYGPVHVYNRALSAAEVAQNYEAQKSKFANTIVQQGLVLNVDINNPYSYSGAGTTAYDVSPTALSWTINNITYNSGPVKYFSYNGSNGWLESSTSTAFDTQTLAMECWCYPTNLIQDGFLFEKGQVNTQYSMFFSSGGSGIFYFRTINLSTQDLTFTSSTYLAANTWNHIVCTYGSGTKTVYINGVQRYQQTGLTGTLPTAQTNQYIGKYGNSGNYFTFNGRIAESRVYNIALSAAQVLQNYNATKSKFGL